VIAAQRASQARCGLGCIADSISLSLTFLAGAVRRKGELASFCKGAIYIELVEPNVAAPNRGESNDSTGR